MAESVSQVRYAAVVGIPVMLSMLLRCLRRPHHRQNPRLYWRRALWSPQHQRLLPPPLAMVPPLALKAMESKHGWKSVDTLEDGVFACFTFCSRRGNEALAVARSLGLNCKKEWEAWCKSGARPANMPS